MTTAISLCIHDTGNIRHEGHQNLRETSLHLRECSLPTEIDIVQHFRENGNSDFLQQMKSLRTSVSDRRIGQPY